MTNCGPSGDVRVEPLDAPVVEGKHVVLDGLDQPQTLQVLELVRMLGREVMRLGPVGGRVVELPDVVVEGREFGTEVPGHAVTGHRRPPLVVDPAVASHFEVLRVPTLVRRGFVEGVGHRDAVDRRLLNSVDERRLRDAGDSKMVGPTSMMWWNCWRISPLARCPSASGRWSRCGSHRSGMPPAWSIGRGVHGVCPAHRVMVVRRGRTELARSGADMNSVVSNSAAPFKEIISLNVPFGVPSALAPLSPMIR